MRHTLTLRRIILGIDKKSSAELSEAINSMFRWYVKAAECDAYLSDVPEKGRCEDHEHMECLIRWEPPRGKLHLPPSRSIFLTRFSGSKLKFFFPCCLYAESVSSHAQPPIAMAPPRVGSMPHTIVITLKNSFPAFGGCEGAYTLYPHTCSHSLR